MKTLISRFSGLLFFVILCSFSANAQFNYGTACVGDQCDGNHNFVIAPGGDCESPITDYQIELNAQTLCPNLEVIIKVFVCGTLDHTFTVQGGTPAFLIPFAAPCHCDVTVTLQLNSLNNGISCKREGFATAILSTF